MVSPGKAELAEAGHTYLWKSAVLCAVIGFVTLFIGHIKLKDQVKELS